jgi:hypothetical protein
VGLVSDAIDRSDADNVDGWTVMSSCGRLAWRNMPTGGSGKPRSIGNAFGLETTQPVGRLLEQDLGHHSLVFVIQQMTMK